MGHELIGGENGGGETMYDDTNSLDEMRAARINFHNIFSIMMLFYAAVSMGG